MAGELRHASCGCGSKGVVLGCGFGEKNGVRIVMVSERRRCIPILALVKAITFCLLKTASISQFSVSAFFCILANNHRGAKKEIRLPAIH